MWKSWLFPVVVMLTVLVAQLPEGVHGGGSLRSMSLFEKFRLRGGHSDPVESEEPGEFDFQDEMKVDDEMKVSTCTRAQLNSLEADFRNSLVSLTLETQNALYVLGNLSHCNSVLTNWSAVFQNLDPFLDEPDFDYAKDNLKNMIIDLRGCRDEWSTNPSQPGLDDLRKLNSFLQTARRKAYSCFKCAQNLYDLLAPGPAPFLETPLPNVNELHPLDVALTETPPDTIIDTEATSSASISANVFKLTYDNQDTRIRTANSYSYGVFSVDFKCPPEFSGLQASFFLSSNADDPKRNGLAFDFIGNNRNRARANSIVRGNSRVYTIDFRHDCSDTFHTYTFAWSPKKIMWLVDNLLVREADSSDPRDARIFPPGDRYYAYLGFRRPMSFGVGRYDGTKAPYVAEFRNFRIGSVQPDITFLAPELPKTPFPLSTVSIAYCQDTVYMNTSETIISWGEINGCGGNVKSPQRYNYGRFSGYVKCAAGNTSGLITSFYLSSFEGSPRVQDEIDFEFLGKDKTVVQTNFWVNGRGGNEIIVPLGFDCSEDYHKYTLDWNPDELKYYIDDKLVRTVLRATSKKGFPKKPSYLYLSVWNADNPSWTGRYFGQDAPYFMYYKDIQIYSPLT